MNRLHFRTPNTATPEQSNPESSYRPAIALLGLGAFLASQCVLPLTIASAQVNRMNEALKAPAVPPPVWWDGAADKGPGKFKPSARVLGVKDDEVSLKKLDLSRAPSEKELRMAGQFGGALSPMSSADPEEWGRKGASAKQLLRLQNMNWGFGRAIQDWNGHKYAKAAKMFKQHVEDYPDSPWAGEALLHLGCDAKYSGRFAEAQATFENLIANTSSKASDPSWEIHQKAKQRWADLDLALGRYDEASQKLADIIKTDTDWRRKTWARHWLVRTNGLKKNKRLAAACGNRALAWALEQSGNKAAAKRVAALIPPREAGFSLEELQRIAIKEGLRTRGFKANTAALAQLPKPFLVHLDYSRGRKVAFDVPAWKNPKKQAVIKSRVFERPSQLGHYLVVSSVDNKTRTVKLWDALEQRPYTMSYTQLEREWSGKGLALLPKTKNVVASTGVTGNAPAESPSPLLWLSKAEMAVTRGGCCGVPSAEENGCGANNQSGNGTGCSKGSSEGAPVWSVNRASINLYITDTPIWYTPPVGPEVKVTMSYNSQDATNQNSVFGNKWAFNYGSYLVVDTNSRPTIFMADGSKTLYNPDGSGGYTSPLGSFDTLVKTGTERYELRAQNGGKLIYDVPSGTSIQQSMLVEMQDRWGYSLTFDYNTNGQMIGITDALGKETNIEYNTAGKIWRVTEPAGRVASFNYDSNGNMVEVTDMEGNSFQYVYDSEVNVTVLDTAQGAWQFYHEPADGIYNSEDPYPAPGDPMWEDSRLTVTDPLGNKEEFHYEGYDGTSWYVSKNNYQAWPNNYYSLSKERYSHYKSGYGAPKVAYYYPATSGSAYYRHTYHSNGQISTVENPTLGRTVSYNYNSKGQVTSVTDAKNQTTAMSYYANGVDLHKITNSANDVIATLEYDTKHQPTKSTDALGREITTTYTSWGARSTVTDDDGHVTTYHYNSATKQLEYIDRDGTTLESFTYDSAGRIGTHTDVNGTTLSYQYTALNQIKRINYPDNTYEEIQYVCCGLPGMKRDRAGRTTYYDYDALKRLIRVQDPAGRTLDTHYDKNGNRVGLIDSNGNETKWEYDSGDRLKKKICADGTYETYSYNSLGLVSSRTDAQGRTTNYAYDGNKNLTGIDYPTDSDVSITYTSLDKLATVTDGLGTTTFGYDDMGQIISVDGPWANDTVTYGINNTGARSNLTVQRDSTNNDSTTYTYDALGRLDTLAASHGTTNVGTFNYNYDSQTQRLSELLSPNGTKANYSYTNLGELDEVENLKSTNVLISRYIYGYDSNHKGLRVSQTRMIGVNPAQTINYSYDNADQIKSEISAETTPSVNLNYSYDLMGNRREVQNQSGGSYSGVVYDSNRLNQLTNSKTSSQTQTLGESTFSYDAGGNLTSLNTGQGGISYLYDECNRLLEVATQNVTTGVNQTKTVFVYDALSRKRICRDYSWDVLNQVWTQIGEKRYIYDGMEVVQERSSNNTVIASLARGYSLGGGIGGLLERTTSAGKHFYHYDGNGNVCQLTSTAETVEAKYDYTAFGVTNSDNTSIAQENPYRYSTKEWHGQAGLYDYGLRYLSTSLGRWINRDPIEEKGGNNLYGFVQNSPLSYVDANGLMPKWAEIAAGIGIATTLATGFNLILAGLAEIPALMPFAPQIGQCMASSIGSAISSALGYMYALETWCDFDLGIFVGTVALGLVTGCISGLITGSGTAVLADYIKQAANGAITGFITGVATGKWLTPDDDDDKPKSCPYSDKPKLDPKPA